MAISKKYNEQGFDKEIGLHEQKAIVGTKPFVKRSNYDEKGDQVEAAFKENLTKEVQERIDLELDTIEWMGFPGYFLIVQDFINHSRDHLGVIIGPGRGSAAGSVVAYCLGIIGYRLCVVGYVC